MDCNPAERVPLTETEVEVFERWFGNLFDELFGPAPERSAFGDKTGLDF